MTAGPEPAQTSKKKRNRLDERALETFGTMFNMVNLAVEIDMMMEATEEVVKDAAENRNAPSEDPVLLLGQATYWVLPIPRVTQDGRPELADFRETHRESLHVPFELGKPCSA
jgi:hypothetical protein